jgi:hypothetical protein
LTYSLEKRSIDLQLRAKKPRMNRGGQRAMATCPQRRRQQRERRRWLFGNPRASSFRGVQQNRVHIHRRTGAEGGRDPAPAQNPTRFVGNASEWWKGCVVQANDVPDPVVLKIVVYNKNVRGVVECAINVYERAPPNDHLHTHRPTQTTCFTSHTPSG